MQWSPNYSSDPTLTFVTIQNYFSFIRCHLSSSVFFLYEELILLKIHLINCIPCANDKPVSFDLIMRYFYIIIVVDEFLSH